MTIEEIVAKAIPLSFPGIKCAAKEAEEKQKAIRRRNELTKNITILLKSSSNETGTKNVPNAKSEKTGHFY